MMVLGIVLVDLLLAYLDTFVSRLLFLFRFLSSLLNFLFWVRLFRFLQYRPWLTGLVDKLSSLVLGD